MKNLNKLALFAAAAAVAMSAGCASTGTTAGSINNWKSSDDSVYWRTGSDDLCWRDAAWTPETAYAECDGAIKAAEPQAPVVVGETVVINDVTTQKVSYSADTLFAFDKAELKPAGKQALDELVSLMNNMQVEVVVATGYTDSTGPAAYNLKLSVRRAEAVKAYLVSRGVPSNLIYIEGKGEADPVATNSTAAGRAQNRRVDIEVVGYQQVNN